jgi:hypothetical protein
MSERVTGKQIRRGWGIKWSDGVCSHEILSDWQRNHRAETIKASGGTLFPVAVVEVDATQPASPDRPPTWGEGIPCGWCKAKSDESVHVWAWTTDGRIQVGRPGWHDTISDDVFSRDFRPL